VPGAGRVVSAGGGVFYEFGPCLRRPGLASVKVLPRRPAAADFVICDLLFALRAPFLIFNAKTPRPNDIIWKRLQNGWQREKSRHELARMINGE